MHMLMTHVTLLLRHKSSFSYLPPLLTRSAIVTTHCFSSSLALPPAAKHRETETSNLCVAREQLLLCLFQGKMLWATFLGVLGAEVLQFLLPLGRPFCGVVV